MKIYISSLFCLTIVILPSALFASYEWEMVHMESQTAYMNGCIKSDHARWNFSSENCECMDWYTNIHLDGKYFSDPNKIACEPDDKVSLVQISYIDHVNQYVRFINPITGYFAVAKTLWECMDTNISGSESISDEFYFRDTWSKMGYLVKWTKCNISNIRELTDAELQKWRTDYIKSYGKKFRLIRGKVKKADAISSFIKEQESLKSPQWIFNNSMRDYWILFAKWILK